MTKRIYMAAKGFSLLEVTLVIIVMSIILSAVTPNYVQGILRGRGEKTALDMYTIQEAARAYCIDKKAWPASIDVLKAQNYLPATWNAKNPFNNAYNIASTPALLTVSSDVVIGVQNTVASRLPASTVAGTMVSSSISTPGSGNSVPVGVLLPWAATTIPLNWLLCNGQTVLQSDYPDLYAVIGTTYGGSGATFKLPDLRGRGIIGLDNMGGANAGVIADSWGSTIGSKFGEEKHLLTIAEMPSHNHFGFGENIPNWPEGALGPNNRQGPPHADYDNYRLGTTYAGGSQSHNNIQPSMALSYIIKGR